MPGQKVNFVFVQQLILQKRKIVKDEDFEEKFDEDVADSKKGTLPLDILTNMTVPWIPPHYPDE
jgi:hypothetical protein